METIIKKLLTLMLSWIMNPENIKKIINWTVEFIDKKAKENPDQNFWDFLDEVIDMLIEAIAGRKFFDKP